MTELAAYVASYCDKLCESDAAATCHRGLTSILTAAMFPDDLTRRAMLYGFADALGATTAPGFDPRWKPAGCH